MKKMIKIALLFIGTLAFTACTSSSSNASVLPETPSFVAGKKDGCSTATGDYTKNSDAFNTDADYKNGWFYGRKTCNPSQAMG
jgi:hypothetical protein